MKVVWGEAAKGEFREAVAFIKRDSPLAARRVARRIRLAARGLENYPDKFRPGYAPNTREHVVPGLPYVIVYRVGPDRVTIMALFHAAQDKPRGG